MRKYSKAADGHVQAVKGDWFLWGLLCCVGVALAVPSLGRTGGGLHIEWLTSWGVSAIFFLYGLTLVPAKLKQGIGKWKVHVIAQVSTFALFPAVVITGINLAPDLFPEPAEIGFFYLAALPSTISSSVAMVSLARGDVSAAVFNATLSSLLGVILTPALVAWYMQGTAAPVPLGPTMGKVMLLVLLPIVIGQVARIWLSGWADRHQRWIKPIDRIIILAIVIETFSNSTTSGLWSQHEATLLIEMAIAVVLIFAVVFAMVQWAARLWQVDRDGRIAALFCATTKSLATGLPLAPVMFGQQADLALIVAPIMMFHFAQLVIVGILAANYGHRAGQEALA